LRRWRRSQHFRFQRNWAGIMILFWVHKRASEYACGISLEGVVEVDEVYVHAGEKGKKEGVGRKRGRAISRRF